MRRKFSQNMACYAARLTIANVLEAEISPLNGNCQLVFDVYQMRQEN